MTATTQEKRATLFELSEDMLALDALLEENDGVEDDTLAGWWSEIRGAVAEKVDRTIGYLKDLEAKAKARKEAAAELTASAKALEHNAARVKRLADLVMVRTGRDAIEGTLWKFARQRNGGVRGLEVLVDARLLPASCVQVIPEQQVPNNDAIRAALGSELVLLRTEEDGAEVYGLKLDTPDGPQERALARLKAPTHSVRVR